MKKVFAIAVFIFSAATFTFAQREQTVVGDAGFNLSGAWGGWTYNGGQFGNDFKTYGGGMWALEFGKKFYIGSQHYRINNQLLNGSTTNSFSLRSDNLLLGYTPMSYRPVHPIISVAFGSGRLNASNEAFEDRVFVIHPMAGVELNLVRWCHIDAQVGYRVVGDTDFTKYAAKDFSGFFGQINLKFGFSWGRYRNSDYRSGDRKRTEKD
jgi:hypothetical protein